VQLDEALRQRQDKAERRERIGFVFWIAANDRRPDAESRAYILTNQADKWVRSYDEHAYVEVIRLGHRLSSQACVLV